MASKNEKAAAKLGMSLKAYKSSSHYKKSKKKSSSKDEKKAKKKIKKYYNENEATTKSKAKTDTKRIQEDMARVLADLGIAQTRAVEDYIRNIGNIEDNKSADIDDLNYYVSNQSGRTQEDLDTALAKETRRYSLEYDKINQDLADRGMTFSERKDETTAKESSDIATEGIKTIASRSFEDISRFEMAKNRDIQLKYGQQETEQGVKKERSLQDILDKKAAARVSSQRGKEDIAFGKSQDIRNIEYARDTDVATLGQQFDAFRLDQEQYEDRKAVVGY